MIYEKKAREKAHQITADWRDDNSSLLTLTDRITAALIEARRAALDEAASKLDGDLHLQDSEMRGYSRSSAARIRALVPTRPDGEAELFAENAKKEGGQ
jgi:hypothetical protein